MNNRRNLLEFLGSTPDKIIRGDYVRVPSWTPKLKLPALLQPLGSKDDTILGLGDSVVYVTMDGVFDANL